MAAARPSRPCRCGHRRRRRASDGGVTTIHHHHRPRHPHQRMPPRAALHTTTAQRSNFKLPTSPLRLRVAQRQGKAFSSPTSLRGEDGSDEAINIRRRRLTPSWPEANAFYPATVKTPASRPTSPHRARTSPFIASRHRHLRHSPRPPGGDTITLDHLPCPAFGSSYAYRLNDIPLSNN